MQKTHDFKTNLAAIHLLLKVAISWGGRDIEYFWREGRTLYGETWHFIGGLDNNFETMLYYFTLIKL